MMERNHWPKDLDLDSTANRTPELTPYVASTGLIGRQSIVQMLIGRASVKQGASFVRPADVSNYNSS